MSINTFADLRREQLRDTGPRGDLARLRQDRFEGVKAGYEADGPDSTVPGASHLIERYALVCESSRGFGYEVNYCENLVSIERAAAANIAEGWGPVCYYDLDTLAGPEPEIGEGDCVSVKREAMCDAWHEGLAGTWYIVDTALEDSMLVCHVAREQDGRSETWFGADLLQVLERAEPDERNPVRYLLAAIRTVVVFNTEPAKP